MRKDESFGAEARHNDEPQGPLVGFLTTRVMTTEREPLFASAKGGTPGQLIDAQIEQMRAEFQEQQRQVPDRRAPELHSITFEFPTE